MNNIYRILLAIVILFSFNACVEEYGETVYSGNVVLEITAPEEVATAAKDLKVVAKLYREYTNETQTIEFKVASVEGTLITTESISVEYGNYELTMENVIANKKPLYVAVDDTDNRAVDIDPAMLIPMAKNILANETTTYAISTVLFNSGEDEVIYGENTVGAFLALTDGTVGTVEGEVIAEDYNEEKTSVTSVTIKDVNGDELLLYGVFRISSDRFEVGKTVKATGEKTTYKDVAQMSFTADKGHSIEIIGGNTEDNFSIEKFMALEDSIVGTVEGKIIAENFNSSYGTVTSVTIKDKNNDELLLYGIFKISSDRYEVGKTVKATGQKITYKETVQMSFTADKGHSIEIIDEGSAGGGNTTDSSLLFAGSDFEDWTAFVASLNSFGLSYTEQSTSGGIDNSSAAHITGTTTTNAYAFTVLSGSIILPESYSKITMYIKGTTSAKSLSINLYYGESNTYAKANFGTINGSTDVTIDATTANNDYSGTINTNGEWVKVTIDLSKIDGFTFNTSSDLSMFAIKVGKESDYDLYIDNITIE